MKRFFFIISILLAGTLYAETGSREVFVPQVETKVMTFNIRYSTKSDGVNSWDNRKDSVINLILEKDVDILGLQEALHEQIMDLEKGLEGYEWLGVGRDDGIEEGEYSPIFYNSRKFSEVGSGYFWLSESPMEAGSIGWDAACPRIAVWAKLRDNRTGKILFVLNTHFDHAGGAARVESAKLILQKLNAYTKKEKYPILVTGDFNNIPDSKEIKYLTNTANPLHLTNTRDIASAVSGPGWTFHDFGRIHHDKRLMLDYVFVKNSISVLHHETIKGNMGGMWISDHCPVLVTVRY